MRDREAVAVGLLVAGTVLLAALISPAVTARPANEIPVTSMPGSGDELASPTGDAWGQVPATDVPLTSAPSSVPNADQTTVETIDVQAATTDTGIYLRLAWDDPTNDSTDADPRVFSDAAAVQLPVNESNRPPIAMGSPRNMVNVWFWSANGGGSELLAGGPGSTTSFADTSVETARQRDGDRWRIVLHRDLPSTSENRTSVTGDRDLDVAFAVWNGSNAERSGRKAVSEWHYLALGPGPSGPPYEAFLWTVAGLAMVFVVAVTAHAVWQSRQEGGEADV